MSVLSPTAGAVTVQRQWISGGCGWAWSVTANTTSFFAADPCDLSIGANATTANNVNIYTGSAGTLTLSPGSGGVSMVGAVPFIFHNANSGSIKLQAPTGALGTQTLTLPDATDTLTGKATTDTLTNKTIASSTDTLGGVTTGLGSDATGDIYYRNSGGQLARLPIGSNTNSLTVSGGLPAWGPSTGAVQKLATLTASSSASLSDTTHITGTYSSYLLVFSNVIPTNDSKILEFQIHSGGAFKASGYAYSLTLNGGGSAGLANSGSSTYIPLSNPADSNNASLHNAAPGYSGQIVLTNPSANAICSVYGQLAYIGAGGATYYIVGQTYGAWTTGGVVDGFQVFMDDAAAPDVLVSGTITIYGIL
jgi:hypothetical protein